MRNIILRIVLIFCTIICALPVFSQPPPPPPGGGPGTPCCWPPPCVCGMPLNSGIIILIALGIGLGLFALNKDKRKILSGN